MFTLTAFAVTNTQNTNESFNASVWTFAPKSSCKQQNSTNISINFAVCQYNHGYKKIMQIMQVLGLCVGLTCYNFCEKWDARRIDIAERSTSKFAKKTRRSMLSLRKKLNDVNVLEEKQLYGAGITD